MDTKKDMFKREHIVCWNVLIILGSEIGIVAGNVIVINQKERIHLLDCQNIHVSFQNYEKMTTVPIWFS